VFVNSGSSANLLAIYYLKSNNISRKITKIIVPVCGFPTTLNPIIQFGFYPIFIDIDSNTLNINI
jgi:CDP-6-deoxy-D-xylo-4-hexulose-3-dehydrase